MLKRIISGVVLALISAAVVFAHSYTKIPTIIYFVLCAGIGTFEILHNTGVIKKKYLAVGCALFSAAELTLLILRPAFAYYLAFVYAFAVAVASLVFYKDFSFSAVAAALAFPLAIAIGFTSTYTVFDRYGLAFLLMLLNFSSVCDMFAYFVGVSLGKHKLCEKISPKKTVEGAVGGILGSIAVTLIISLVADISGLNLVMLLIITPFMCAVGMIGDLFASIIKRSVSIKDYGNLIPGHGGILDRFDSILLISPVFLMLLEVLP
ncbi:MAG: phosphatidate cytidylyltransferase [Clostridiales bacterium]|nr:phosphatidate cytidylyltransferase [Candidatus Equinaster intestinalis]